MEASRLGGGELGHRLGALRHGVLGQLIRIACREYVKSLTSVEPSYPSVLLHGVRVTLRVQCRTVPWFSHGLHHCTPH